VKFVGEASQDGQAVAGAAAVDEVLKRFVIPIFENLLVEVLGLMLQDERVWCLVATVAARVDDLL
jgi:hypothetical protein